MSLSNFGLQLHLAWRAMCCTPSERRFRAWRAPFPFVRLSCFSFCASVLDLNSTLCVTLAGRTHETRLTPLFAVVHLYVGRGDSRSLRGRPAGMRGEYRLASIYRVQYSTIDPRTGERSRFLKILSKNQTQNLISLYRVTLTGVYARKREAAKRKDSLKDQCVHRHSNKDSCQTTAQFRRSSS